MTVADFPQAGTIGTSLLPTRWDIAIYQGDTFDVVVNFKDANGAGIDLTGFTALIQFKSSVGTVVATPTTELNYDGVLGALRIFLETDTLTAGDYTYDLQLNSPDGKKRTFIGGVVTVTSDISE